MPKDPLNLDSAAYECLGHALVLPDGTAFLEELIKLKNTYEKIEHPQKNVRKVANHSSVILDLQTSSVILNLTNGNSYIGIKDLVKDTFQGATYPLIKRGIRTLKKEGKNYRSGAYEYRENIFLIYKMDFAERKNLFIKVSDK